MKTLNEQTVESIILNYYCNLVTKKKKKINDLDYEIQRLNQLNTKNKHLIDSMKRDIFYQKQLIESRDAVKRYENNLYTANEKSVKELDEEFNLVKTELQNTRDVLYAYATSIETIFGVYDIDLYNFKNIESATNEFLAKHLATSTKGI
jgi:predicted RNase H-like nuclease (RuvC/YqgF family)